MTEFLKKWHNIVSRLSFDLRGVVLYLLRNIEYKTKLDIIKKSEVCLGKIAILFDKEMVGTVLNDPEWGLLKFITMSHSNLSSDSLRHARNGLLCLTQVVKTHNIELRHWAKDIAHMLLTIIKQFRHHDDIDNIEIVCDILDASLTALAYLIRTFSRELRE